MVWRATSVTEVLALRRLVTALQHENALLRAAAPARELAAVRSRSSEDRAAGVLL